MSNVYITLVALKLASPDDQVELSVTTSLTFKCSDPATHSFTSQKLFEALRTAKVVAKRGPECRIDVDVERDGVVVDDELAGILKESLGLVISHAPWWSQLPICPVLQRLPDNFLNKFRPFSITIAGTLPDFHLADNQQVNTSSQDVKIPAGVPVLQIQCIAVKFQFRRLIDTIDTKDNSPEPMDISFEGILDGHEPHDDHILFNEPGHSELHSIAEARHPIQTIELGFSNAFENEDSYLLEDGEAMVNHSFTDNFSPFESQESGQTDLTTPDEDSANAACVKTRTTEAVTSLLTDVAMRTLIGGEQSKPTPGIRLLKPLPTHTLAALMPLLFSPNFSSVGSSSSCKASWLIYFWTMHQRSRFLPTITSTISSLGVAAQSPTLKFKLAELKKKGHNSITPSLAGAVQSHAYRVMHTSLFSAKAARFLRMQPHEEDKKNDVEDSMIIDGSAVNLEIRKSPAKSHWDCLSDMDFDDMLQDEDEIDMLLDLEIMRQGHLPSCNILLPGFGGQEDLPMIESEIDLGMRDPEDKFKGPRDEYMIEISDKSIIAEDTEQHLLVDTAPMLF